MGLKGAGNLTVGDKKEINWGQYLPQTQSL